MWIHPTSKNDRMKSKYFLPVNKRVIIGSIILNLKHAYSRYIPLEVKFDECSR